MKREADIDPAERDRRLRVEHEAEIEAEETELEGDGIEDPDQYADDRWAEGWAEVSREMALDAEDPSLEGTMIKW